MRAVVQRVHEARVTVDEAVVGEIGAGLLVLLGVGHDDTGETAKAMAAKIAKLRIFEDGAGKMNRSVADAGGGVLVVSQFTLYGDARKGNRPSFIKAARPEEADPLCDRVVAELDALGLPTATGVFGAHMEVSLTNDGPVTILLEM
jgi:D-tyrosyl-tRNA(Tyr) deacylase